MEVVVSAFNQEKALVGRLIINSSSNWPTVICVQGLEVNLYRRRRGWGDAGYHLQDHGHTSKTTEESEEINADKYKMNNIVDIVHILSSQYRT